MAEPVRIGLDGCVLPRPIDGTQEYLAAIFDELRALRTHTVPAPEDGDAAPAPEVGPVPEPVLIEEPAAAPLDVHALIEAAAEAEVPEASAAPQKTQSRKRRAPRTRAK